MTTKNTHSGFTLIEILIALTVFAIIATMTSSILYYAFNTRSRVSEHAERLAALQLAVSLIERDMAQTTVRPVRGNEMSLQPAFTGEGHTLEFTRGGFANPDSLEKRSTLKRMALLCHKNQLLQRTWIRLDAVDRNKYEDRILLDHLNACQFHYLNRNLQVLSVWRANAVAQNQKNETLPKAVQLSISFKGEGQLDFLFLLPGALYVS